MALSTLDLVIVALYASSLLAIALWVSREPAGETKDTEDYFLAGRALPWWAIGASLIASNISAEQIIGQSGQGFAVGVAIAAYEWQAAIVLILVAKYFLLTNYLNFLNRKGLYLFIQKMKPLPLAWLSIVQGFNPIRWLSYQVRRSIIASFLFVENIIRSNHRNNT